MKIGILYPSSKAHPNIAINFMYGLKSFLIAKQIIDTFIFCTEGIGIGGTEKEVYKSVEKLLVIDTVDILIAFIDEKVVDILSPLINATGKLLIIVNAGANIPNNWIPQPNFIRLNLQHAFLCWLTGALAGNTPNTQAATASTFYDCGYWHVAAMVKNFNKHGGYITYNYINNQAYNNQFNIDELTQFLSANNNTKNLLCLFDTLPASLFYNLLNNFKNADELNLFVSPMMLQKEACSNTNYKFSINGYLPWINNLQTDANISFKNICTKDRDIFSLLGYETALILHQILLNNNDSIINITQVIQQLKTAPIQSPRGLLQLDIETQIYIAPIAKCILKPNATTLTIEHITEYKKDWEAFISEPMPTNSSGWTNTYLCY